MLHYVDKQKNVHTYEYQYMEQDFIQRIITLLEEKIYDFYFQEIRNRIPKSMLLEDKKQENTSLIKKENTTSISIVKQETKLPTRFIIKGKKEISTKLFEKDSFDKFDQENLKKLGQFLERFFTTQDNAEKDRRVYLIFGEPHISFPESIIQKNAEISIQILNLEEAITTQLNRGKIWKEKIQQTHEILQRHTSRYNTFIEKLKELPKVQNESYVKELITFWDTFKNSVSLSLSDNCFQEIHTQRENIIKEADTIMEHAKLTMREKEIMQPDINSILEPLASSLKKVETSFKQLKTIFEKSNPLFAFAIKQQSDDLERTWDDKIFNNFCHIIDAFLTFYVNNTLQFTKNPPIYTQHNIERLSHRLQNLANTLHNNIHLSEMERLTKPHLRKSIEMYEHEEGIPIPSTQELNKQIDKLSQLLKTQYSEKNYKEKITKILAKISYTLPLYSESGIYPKAKKDTIIQHNATTIIGLPSEQKQTGESEILELPQKENKPTAWDKPNYALNTTGNRLLEVLLQKIQPQTVLPEEKTKEEINEDELKVYNLSEEFVKILENFQETNLNIDTAKPDRNILEQAAFSYILSTFLTYVHTRIKDCEPNNTIKKDAILKILDTYIVNPSTKNVDWIKLLSEIFPHEFPETPPEVLENKENQTFIKMFQLQKKKIELKILNDFGKNTLFITQQFTRRACCRMENSLITLTNKIHKTKSKSLQFNVSRELIACTCS